MKTLLLVTYVDFWRTGSGHRARINSIVQYFKGKAKITVFFAGAKEATSEMFLNKLYPEVTFEFAILKGQITYKDCKQKFAEFIEDKYFDFALVEYIELSIILEYLPETTITFLDTHDLIHNRISTFAKFKLPYDGIILTKEEEIEIFKCFDYIILIQKADYEEVSVDIDHKSLLLMPHPVFLEKKSVRRNVKNVCYVASSYQPNIDALDWFISSVWDKVNGGLNLRLNVYGTINMAFSHIKKNNIIFYGLVDNLEDIYNRVDVIINPIRCGAGLKIKNVEALGHGIPLITTTHGTIGMEDGASNAFLVADTTEQYLSAFDLLVKNFDAREQLSTNAFRYASENFSEKKCYQSLLKILNTC